MFFFKVISEYYMVFMDQQVIHITIEYIHCYTELTTLTDISAPI